jgi:hypothetical protein
MTRVFDINPNNIVPANNVVLGAVTINGVTIENGLAQPGDGATGSGGGLNYFSLNQIPLTTQNTIIAQNLASNVGPDVRFTVSPRPGTVDQGGNLIGVGNTLVFTAATTQQGTATHPLNPLLGPLTNNGGPVAGAPGNQMTVETEAELLGSPAIGKGVANGIPTDERGAPRNGAIDVGAFQFENVTLQLNIGTQTTLTLGSTETVTVTVTNTSDNPLPCKTAIRASWLMS